MLTRKVWKGVLFENLTKKQQKEILYSSTIDAITSALGPSPKIINFFFIYLINLLKTWATF
jgi:hypothetical protein